MSEIQLAAFLNKTLSFFVQFLMVIFLFMITVEFAIFYIMSNNMAFYYASIFVFMIVMVYSFDMVKKFQGFQDMFDQNISNSKYSSEMSKPLDMETEELPLKACLYYRNSHSFVYVAKALGLGHPELARRQVIKGLDILLKNYEEHNIKEVQAK